MFVEYYLKINFDLNSASFIEQNMDRIFDLICEIQGLDKFKGKVFHSAQWDLEHDYKNEKVAIIGSGASAVQIAPAIGN